MQTVSCDDVLAQAALNTLTLAHAILNLNSRALCAGNPAFFLDVRQRPAHRCMALTQNSIWRVIDVGLHFVFLLRLFIFD
jgi:hypothetical protein